MPSTSRPIPTQPLKASSPITVAPLAITQASREQFLNAAFPILLTLDGVIIAIMSPPSKAPAAMPVTLTPSTVSGRVIERADPLYEVILPSESMPSSLSGGTGAIMAENEATLER